MRSATKKKLGRDPEYLAWIRALPCVICFPTLWKMGSDLDSISSRQSIQDSPTEAAHVGDRGLSHKSDDQETIPLCEDHHRLGPDAHHQLGKWFWIHHKIDKVQLILELQERHEKHIAGQ